ncbi:MAG: hypothetical protein ACI4UU_00915 [Clostridia bacterium]
MQDGIVIQNETDLNEFVWVPVGEIKNDAVENTTNKTTITLGRYEDFTVAANGTLPTPAQTASKTAYDTPTLISSYYIEISSSFAGGTFGGKTYKAASSYGNTKVLNLQEWISTSLDNGGYYIARYEASKKGEKAASKATTVDSATSNDATITDGMLWNNITQPNAAIAAKAMYPYSSTAKYYSDLINDYAWDTAIIFIEAYSDATYATKKANDINTNIAKAGENEDKKCNIQDMAGNVLEWSTETYTDSNTPCTSRGGYYNSNFTTSRRSANFATLSRYHTSFRGSLCVK